MTVPTLDGDDKNYREDHFHKYQACCIHKGLGGQNFSTINNRRDLVHGEWARTRNKNRITANNWATAAWNGDSPKMHWSREKCQMPELAVSARPPWNAGPVVRQSPIDGAIQRFIQTSLAEGIMNPTHYERIAGYTLRRRVYDTMQMHYYWLHTENIVYRAVKQCRSYANGAAKTWH